jgi:hypothetical protein
VIVDASAIVASLLEEPGVDCAGNCFSQTDLATT